MGTTVLVHAGIITCKRVMGLLEKSSKWVTGPGGKDRRQ